MPKVAILLSGGIDSIALTYWKRPDIAITINYGQAPALTEIRTSETISKILGIPHYVVEADCSSLGSGDLINQTPLGVSPSSEWWPYRNQLLITLACMKGISLGINELMLASVKSDSFHKDGTAQFYGLMSQLMVYQEQSIKVTCPAIELTSVELVQRSNISASLLNWAHSCHKSNIPCGDCRGCNKYRQVIYELQQNGYEKSKA